MLQTLIQIGRNESKNMGKWDDIIDVPNLEKERERESRLYTASMLFDLNNESISVSRESIQEYYDKAPTDFKNIKIQVGRNNSIYLCVFAPKSLEQFRKTFFGTIGKGNSEPLSGEFTKAIEKDFSELSESVFANALKSIFKLRSVFEAEFIDKKSDAFLLKPPQKGSEETPSLFKKLSFDKTDVLVLLYASVVSSELGIDKPTLVSELPGYEEFLEKKFIGETVQSVSNEKLCYASGKIKDDVTDISFSGRHNINKMFVTTTRNYASGMQADGFGNSYQASSEVQKFLDRGSDILLNNHRVLIAGISHCIIPQVFNQPDEIVSKVVTNFSKRTELLFQKQLISDMNENIEDADPLIFWIDFLGYETDGKSFKTINYIKDVTQMHFNRLVKTFQVTNRELRKVEGISWTEVMTRGKEKKTFAFNFYSLYNLIPLRKDKEKKNEALVLFKAILEQRTVSKKKLMQFYKELVLCHRYQRYRSYTNIYSPDSISNKALHFDYAVRDATYQYLATLQILTQLNLLNDMEETNEIELLENEEQDDSPTQKKIALFFEKMQYSEQQKAMFYLGRALSSIASAQVQAKHPNKPILEKVNYNGMDTRSILKLYRELREKIKQYTKFNTLKYVEPTLSRFDELFKLNDWNLNPEESLFFMFSGYSFYVESKKSNYKEESKS